MLYNAINKKMKQITNHIMMIEPVSFNFNEETSVDNHYQNSSISISQNEIQEKALNEFQNFVEVLENKGVNVIVFKDTMIPLTPDSIFPNNWVSFHENGSIFLYPMLAKNRRKERRDDIISFISSKFQVSEIHSLVDYENQNLFLEGTGSLILDRKNRICYAARSKRTDEKILLEFCDRQGFTPFLFSAYQNVDSQRLPIYHTNVLMCIANNYAIICLDSIDNKQERENIIKQLNSTNKEIIEIFEEQVNSFAGNMLQVMGDKEYLVMSSSALNSLNKKQKKSILFYNEIIDVDLSIIESCGGGSARCMMGEIFLNLKND